MPVIRTAPGESVTFRALGLLDAFDEQHRVLSLSQIARRARVPIATAQRRLRDLTDGRLVQRREDGLFEIGSRMWHLGLLSRHTSMREAALPHLQDLVAKSGHTVHLGVLDGDLAMIVDRIAGTRTLPTRHLPGARLPLHCTAIGKVLLAFAPREVQERALAALSRHTPFTITDPVIMRAQLDAVVRTRIVDSHQQHRMGVTSVAVPVIGQAGSVLAGIAIMAPAEASLDAHRQSLRMCAQAIARSVEILEHRWYDE
jgi:DNA-binding IclR family transcriptional regulator